MIKYWNMRYILYIYIYKHWYTDTENLQTVDYSLSSDYSGESEQTAFTPVIVSGPDWFKCIFKQIPPEHLRPLFFLLIGTFVVLFIILSLCLRWIYICTEDDSSSKDKLIDTSNSLKVTLYHTYIPDESPLYKEPPPKYDQLLDQPETYSPDVKVNI